LVKAVQEQEQEYLNSQIEINNLTKEVQKKDAVIKVLMERMNAIEQILNTKSN